DEARQLLDGGLVYEAQTSAKRAKSLLQTGEGSADLRRQVRQVWKDLEMVERHEQLRLAELPAVGTSLTTCRLTGGMPRRCGSTALTSRGLTGAKPPNGSRRAPSGRSWCACSITGPLPAGQRPGSSNRTGKSCWPSPDGWTPMPFSTGCGRPGRK